MRLLSLEDNFQNDFFPMSETSSTFVTISQLDGVYVPEVKIQTKIRHGNFQLKYLSTWSPSLLAIYQMKSNAV